MASDDTHKRVLSVLVRNQKMAQEEDNYCREVSRELALDRDTVRNSIGFMEELGVVKRKRKGKKKVVMVNSSIIENMELDQGQDSTGKPSLGDSMF